MAQFVITLQRGYPFSTASKALVDAGCEIRDTMIAMSVLVVECDAALQPQLKTIPGVADVALETPINIGPPETDPTW